LDACWLLHMGPRSLQLVAALVGGREMHAGVAAAAGLEQYGCVDWRVQMFQLDPTDAAGKPLRFGKQAAANFNLTAQTTNLGRVTMAGIAQRVRCDTESGCKLSNTSNTRGRCERHPSRLFDAWPAAPTGQQGVTAGRRRCITHLAP
jgi:hypothetical protein